jgi:hypothetical protein
VVEVLPSAIERGESALRAVPGLVAIRAFDAARQVLSGYIDYLDEGVAPSGFDPVDGRPLYGDPAPSLWLIHATDLYVRRSGETELLADRLFQPLESIMQSFRQGTRHGITVDRDGLLATGRNGDLFKRSDHNALWYHALVAMAQLARLIGRKESGAFYLAWAREHQKQFNDEMWDEQRGCLYEGLGPRGPVAGLAPSQVLAASLPPAVLQPELAERLVRTIERALFTPLGLRDAPGSERVSAAWMGPFITAHLRVRGRTPDAHRQAQEWMLGLLRRSEALLGRLPAAFALAANGHASVSVESGGIASGAEPTSVLAAAELLRVWIEELDRSELANEAGAPLAPA